tara:strand:- start:40 stop:150 length:111 start_codon:yes stop_codon:yes gene_type:complete
MQDVETAEEKKQRRSETYYTVGRKGMAFFLSLNVSL